MRHFFGYGSLVNLRTHDYPQAQPARVLGWRRVWRHTPHRAVAYLTVEPAPDVTISGMVALVPDGDWAALDRREAAYARQPLGAALRDAPPDVPDAAIYVIPDGQHAAPTAANPILLSYLDVVAQGYLHQFGTEGLAEFFATTAGWQAPVLDDRATPRYPRHQGLTGAERQIVDDYLDALAVRRLTP